MYHPIDGLQRCVQNHEAQGADPTSLPSSRKAGGVARQDRVLDACLPLEDHGLPQLQGKQFEGLVQSCWAAVRRSQRKSDDRRGLLWDTAGQESRSPAGVADKSLYMFQVDATDLSISPLSIESVLDKITKARLKIPGVV